MSLETLNPVAIYKEYYEILGKRKIEDGDEIDDYKIPDYEGLPILQEKVQILENLKNNNCLIIKVYFNTSNLITVD